MKRHVFIIIILLFFVGWLPAQNKISYTVAGLKQEFVVSQERFYITFKQIYQQEIQNSELFKKHAPISDTSAVVTLNENYDGVVAIDNNDNENRNFTLTFLPDFQEIGNKIYEDANVRIVLDNVLRSIWINGGKQAYNIIEENDTTLKIIGNNATLSNLIFNANLASDQVTVNYKVNQGEEAYLYVINSQDASKEVRYSIDSLTDEFVIDLTNYASGIYAVSLIVDGLVEDTKTLIKQ